MTEMIERVARALKAFSAAELLETGSVNGTRWEAMARAAIDAMWEPTREMIIAMDWTEIWPEHLAWDETKKEWRSMIDAALGRGGE